MKKQIKLVHLVFLSLAILLGSCAPSIMIPARRYVPQNIVRFQGNVSMGKFTYEPATKGELEPNQLDHNKAANIYLPTNVADYVNRATTLELERTGVTDKQDNNLILSGNIHVFKLTASTFSTSYDWEYAISYKITQKSDGKVLLEKEYKTTKSTGSFRDINDVVPTVDDLIITAYENFIKDNDVRNILKDK